MEWSTIPSATKSFALIVEDPDAPRVTPWVHWLIWNIPAYMTNLQENISRTLQLKHMNQGKNDFGKIGYDGPCPPPGKIHRYFFRLYALDNELSLNGSVTKEELLHAMKGHVLAEAQLIGLYQIGM